MNFDRLRGHGRGEPVRRRAAAMALLVAAWLPAGGAGPGERAEAQIRERIASIRTAILERRPEGIVRWGTEDWSFTGPDGQTYDRAAYLVRTRNLFARVVAVDALDTQVDRVAVAGDTAAVELTQTMERRERDAATGRVQRLRLRYRESHTWVRTADGWRVRRVAFLGAPERTELGPG